MLDSTKVSQANIELLIHFYVQLTGFKYTTRSSETECRYKHKFTAPNIYLFRSILNAVRAIGNPGQVQTEASLKETVGGTA